MITRFWMIIRDDSKRTFEVCGQESNDNALANRTYAMQRAGMNVSHMAPPVSHKMSSKALVKVAGYKSEDGLFDRLQTEYRRLIQIEPSQEDLSEEW